MPTTWPDYDAAAERARWEDGLPPALDDEPDGDDPAELIAYYASGPDEHSVHDADWVPF